MSGPQLPRSSGLPREGNASTSGEPSTEIPPQTPLVIHTPDQRIRVFVSSTLDELAPERAAARQAITQLRLTPVMFELGARPYPPRDLYRAYLAQSDIFVGIYWQRYGWVAPDREVSGLEDEEQLSAGKPRLIYLKTPAPQREPRLQALLDRMRAEEVVSYQKFATPDELRETLANDLAVLLTERFTGATGLTQRARSSVPEPTAGPPARLVLPPLPVPRGRLIDRTREVATARDDLLAEYIGLVTLTGPGGVGKTRVALQAAAECGDRFSDGVAFLSLAALTDPGLLVATIAQGLGVAGDDRRPVDEHLLEWLRPKHLLLVLDNLEQVVAAAAAWIAAALEAAPRLTILATSREALRVRDEQVILIPPLGLPDTVDQATSSEVARLAEVPSVALFVTRAREIQPDFDLTTDNAPAVVAICRRLDGLPLAIELAVARLPVLPPAALLARLEHRLPVLTRGPRDLPARQQTLRDTIAWSYDLLSEGDQALLRQLAVFAGGCTLEAAQAVCRVAEQVSGRAADQRTGKVAEESAATDLAVLEGMASLVDKSLLQTQSGAGGDVRFAMLETIREFAHEQLLASREAGAVQQRHADFFLRLAEAAQPHMYLHDRDVWMARLEGEDGNFRAALTWCAAEQAAASAHETGLNLAGALAWYWYTRGRLREGRSWLEGLLAQAAARSEELQQRVAGRVALGKAYQGLGLLAVAQGDADTAAAHAEQSVAIFRALGPTESQWLAFAVALLGMVRISQGAPDQARPLLEESMALLQGVGGPTAEAYQAYNLFQLGRAAQAAGDLEGARAYYEQSQALFRAVDDPLGIAMTADGLGLVSAAHGDEATSHRLLAETLPPVRATGDRYELAQLLEDAGTAALRHGDLQQAQGLFIESVRLWGDIGVPVGIAGALAGLAGVATSKGQAERAGRLFGAARALLSPSGRLTGDAGRLELDRSVAEARAHLDAAAFAAGWAAGQTMTREQAIASASEGT